MMKRTTKTVFCLLMAAVIMSAFASLFFVSASGDTVVTGYTMDVSKLQRDDIAKITVSVKSLTLTTGTDIDSTSEIDITRCVDSFYSGNVPIVTITSEDGALLTYNVYFSAMRYRGNGNTLSFVVTYNGDASSAQTLEISVAECVPQSEEAVPDTQSTTASNSSAETTTKAVAAPTVSITRNNFPSAIKPGTTFDLSVVIKNAGSPYTITTGTVSFEPSEGLILNENSSSKSVSDIRTNASKTVTVKLTALKSIENASQSVSVSFKYYYQSAEGAVQDSASEKLNIPVTIPATESSTESAAKATPNIIVSSYDYGGKSIAVGSSFNLSLTFRNTSKLLKVENLVMSVETGEGLSIASSSNAYYYDAVAAGKSETRTIKMNVTANAVTGGCVIDLSFKYEYIDKGLRSSGTSSERLYIPVYLPDRFTVTAPDSLYAVQNQELSISLPYVNKSKGTVSNVAAELVYDGAAAYCEFPTQNLGNFEAGKSGTIDFFLTPSTTDEMTVTVKVTYETETGDTKTLSVPMSFTPDPEMPYIDPGFSEPDIPEETEGGIPTWVIIALAGVVLLLIILFIILRRRKKKKAAMEISPDFDWSAPQPADVPNNTPDRNDALK